MEAPKRWDKSSSICITYLYIVSGRVTQDATGPKDIATLTLHFVQRADFRVNPDGQKTGNKKPAEAGSLLHSQR
jgi:hypothetical protein